MNEAADLVMEAARLRTKVEQLEELLDNAINLLARNGSAIAAVAKAYRIRLDEIKRG